MPRHGASLERYRRGSRPLPPPRVADPGLRLDRTRRPARSSPRLVGSRCKGALGSPRRPRRPFRATAPNSARGRRSGDRGEARGRVERAADRHGRGGAHRSGRRSARRARSRRDNEGIAPVQASPGAKPVKDPVPNAGQMDSAASGLGPRASGETAVSASGDWHRIWPGSRGAEYRPSVSRGRPPGAERAPPRRWRLSRT